MKRNVSDGQSSGNKLGKREKNSGNKLLTAAQERRKQH